MSGRLEQRMDARLSMHLAINQRPGMHRSFRWGVDMKRTITSHRNVGFNKLSLRAETIRTLTERELILVVAGNCVNASMFSQNTTTNLIGC